MIDCKSFGTPTEPGSKLRKDDGEKEVDNTYFKPIVGSLMENPSEIHLNAARRVLRYVKGTIDYGVFYKKENGTDLVGYTDSDYAGDIYDCKSTSGHAFMLNSSAILWTSKK